MISASRAARGLKFWLQVALGPPIAPWGLRPDPVHPDPGNPVFPEIFFSLFFASTDPLGPQGRPRMDRNHLIRTWIREIRILRIFLLFSLLWTSWDLRVTPRMFRYHLIRIRTGKSGFSKIRIFRFFDFLSLKTLQYGCLMTPLDHLMDPWWSRTHPDIRIREIRIFRKFFFAFFASTGLLDLRVTPRMVRNHLIRIPTGKSGFLKIRIFHFFDWLIEKFRKLSKIPNFLVET